MTMKAKLRGATGLPFDVIEVSYNVYEKFTGKEAMPFCQYYMDEEGAIYEGSALDFNLDPQQPERNCHSKQVKHKKQE